MGNTLCFTCFAPNDFSLKTQKSFLQRGLFTERQLFKLLCTSSTFISHQYESRKTDINLNENATAHYFNVELHSGNKMWIKYVLEERRTESPGEAIETDLTVETECIVTRGGGAGSCHRLGLQ